MNRFKVVHVIRPAAGGMKRHLLNLLEHTDRDLFEPVVACPYEEKLFEAAESGARVFTVSLPGEIKTARDTAAVLRIAGVLRKEKAVILHAHGSKAGLVGRLAARLARTPVVFFTAHNSIFYEQWPEYKRKAFAIAENMLARGTFKIIAVSNALRQELLDREGLQPDRVVTVYNGIDPAAFRVAEERAALRLRLNLPADAAVVGTVARLAPQKGVRLLIQAAALIPPEKRPFFLIVGDGPLRRELEEAAGDFGVADRFIFTGARTDIPRVLGALDLLALPSVTEGLPLILLEAMAASLPVVATAVGGVPEVVVDGKTGVMVRSADPAGLAWGITQILEEPDLARRMGAAGEKRVSELFTVEKMAGRVMNLYREALTNKGMWCDRWSCN
ncbi:MAG: glycosyltransferase [Bacillota bacterium]